MLNPHIGYGDDDDDVDDEVWTTPNKVLLVDNNSNNSSHTRTSSLSPTNASGNDSLMMSSVDDIPTATTTSTTTTTTSSSSSTTTTSSPYSIHGSGNSREEEEEEDDDDRDDDEVEDEFDKHRRNISNNNSSYSDDSSSDEQVAGSSTKPPRKWLQAGETINFTKESIMYKMNIGNIYVTSKRVVWTGVNSDSIQDVYIEILHIYQTSMSTSSNQSCWKISSSGGDFLFFFQSKDDIREINTYYQKSKAQIYEQNPSLKKTNPHQLRQQQQQQHQQQQQQSKQQPPLQQQQPSKQQTSKNPVNNNHHNVHSSSEPTSTILYPNLGELNVNSHNNNHHQQQHKDQFPPLPQKQPVVQSHHNNNKQKTIQALGNSGTTSQSSNNSIAPSTNNPSNSNGKKKKQVDEDFVSINEGLSVGDAGDSSWDEETNGNGLEQFGYFDIEVKDPRRNEEDGQTYVNYEVTGKFKDEKGTAPTKVRRRYKEFEWLHQQLSLPSNLHVKVPALPQKSMVQFWNKTDQTAVVKRCFQLDSFMKEISKSVSLRNHPAMRVFMTGKPISVQQTTFTDFIGSAISSNTLPGLNDSPLIDQNFIYNSVVERDYWLIRRLMKKWELLPKKLPFQKFLVVVLGTTSAGKSSFINNFFNIQVKRSAIGQLDTHFTLVETIPKDQFAQLSDKLLNSRNEKPRKFTQEQLNEKITTEPMSDPRYGHVFLYMDTTYTLSRYDAQFSGYSDIISKYGLVRSILINDEYLTGTDEEKEYQRRTIFLDSPGFESKKESNPESLLGNIKIIQFFYSTSDLTLFMMPAKNISLVSPQIQILEISVMYKLYGPEIVDQMVTKIVKQRSESKSFLSFPEIAKFIVNQFSRENRRPNQEYVGTLVWDKIRFLLTQIDDIQTTEESNLREQYFELGRLLGKSLTFLDPPTFTQCMAIALPLDRVFKSPEEKKQRCGDLDTLLNYIRSLNSDSSYHQRLEAAIQEMALALQPHIQNSWKNYLDLNQWISSDFSCVDQIRERSSARLRNSKTS